MKGQRIVLISIIVLCVLMLNLAACGWDDPNGSIKSTPQPGELQAQSITATYGANEFHIQLTAIAEQPAAGSSRLIESSRFP